MEANPRFSDEASQIDQLILRPAIKYQLTSTLSLWQGYSWVANYEPEYSQEHRVFQQLIYLKAFVPVKLFSRSRLEEQWLQNAVGTSIRARTMLCGDFPIPAHPSLAIVVYDEIFVNLNTIRQGPEAGFDQNRFFVGLNYIISPTLSVDVGYQSQIVNTPLAGPANQAKPYFPPAIFHQFMRCCPSYFTAYGAGRRQLPGLQDQGNSCRNARKDVGR